MPAQFENGEKCDGLPFYKKTANFAPEDFENGRFWKRNSNRHILEKASCGHLKMMKTEHFSTFLERDW